MHERPATVRRPIAWLALALQPGPSPCLRPAAERRPSSAFASSRAIRRDPAALAAALIVAGHAVFGGRFDDEVETIASRAARAAPLVAAAAHRCARRLGGSA